MHYFLIIAAMLIIATEAMNAQTSTTPANNPLLTEWKTPFGIPPFSEIKEDHFVPAYKTAIAEYRAEIGAILARAEAPSFSNTIESLNNCGELLDKVAAVFNNLNSAETNARLQAIAREVSPLLSALRDDIMLNEVLFARVKAVWERCNELSLQPDQKRLVEETYKAFVRGGALATPDQKQRLRAINEELSLLSLKFGENLLKETNSYKLWVTTENELNGLPAGLRSAAKDAAIKAGEPSKWLFTLHAPSIWPFLSYAENRELRRQILTAYSLRGDNPNSENNNDILVRIATLRAEKAALLGYKTHAHFVLEENMAKTPEQVDGLLDQLWTPAVSVARKEANDIRAMIRAEGGTFPLEAWDWRYYAEKVKKAKFDLDETEVSQYFVLDNVREGAFFVANQLFGITFNERTDLPKYHPEVLTFEVSDTDGSHLGIFLVDYHPRPGKRSGAWASRYRGQYVKDGKEIRPLVANVCNFTRPSGDTPALLTIDEVETLFHEFGHALHSLFSRIRYKSLAGTPRDFVELPSQIMENWAFRKEVLAVYAKHVKTGEPMPDALVEKILNAEKFNQGFASVEYLAASYLDMDWHTLLAAPTLQANEFEKEAMKKIGLMPEILPRYRSSYFQHIFSGGYSAGYYSYIWSEVLDSDAFAAFVERGIFDKELAASFRKNILERGGTEDAAEMYRKFRGRDPVVQPLLEKRGLN